MSLPDEEIRIRLGITDIASHTSFLCEPPEQLFHYTSLDGMAGIISSKALRLTKAQYLNDQTELLYAINLFREQSIETTKELQNSEKIEFLRDVSENLKSFERTNICVASFCEDGDLLSQWRAYSHRGNGVALGFNAHSLKEINNSGWARLIKCVYDGREHIKIIEDLMTLLLNAFDTVFDTCQEETWSKTRNDLIGYFNTTFLRSAPALKDPSFSEEKEWRIVTVPRPHTDPNYFAIVSNDCVTQFYLLRFTPDSDGKYRFLSSIVLGPSAEPDKVASALHAYCVRENVAYGSIRFSQIPFRG